MHELKTKDNTIFKEENMEEAREQQFHETFSESFQDKTIESITYNDDKQTMTLFFNDGIFLEISSPNDYRGGMKIRTNSENINGKEDIPIPLESFKFALTMI